MSIFKANMHRTRSVPVTKTMPPGCGLESYTYDREENAFGRTQYFTTLAKAQAYLQQHSTVPLQWESNFENHWSATVPDPTENKGEFYFSVETEAGAELDTTGKQFLPTNWYEPRHAGD